MFLVNLFASLFISLFPAQPRAFAFGKKCAMVYTTPLNKRATSSSALPTVNSLQLGSHRGPL